MSRNIVYQVVKNTLAEIFWAEKKSTKFRIHKKSHSPSKQSKTLFARQIKQYETTKPI